MAEADYLGAGVGGQNLFLNPLPVHITGFDGTTYNTVAASQTAQALVGADSGAAGDLLIGLLIVPATTSPGAVSIKDGNTVPGITIFTGGASSLATLAPLYVPIGAVSISGAWKVTTGANVSVVAVGRFT